MENFTSPTKVNGTCISQKVSEMDDFLRNLQHLYNKQDGRVSKENSSLQFNADTDRDEFFEAFQIGGALFLAALHFKVAKTHFTETEFFRERITSFGEEQKRVRRTVSNIFHFSPGQP